MQTQTKRFVYQGLSKFKTVCTIIVSEVVWKAASETEANQAVFQVEGEIASLPTEQGIPGGRTPRPPR